MRGREMDRKEKLAKLRKMIQQVAPAETLETPTLALESTEASGPERDLVEKGMFGLLNDEEISPEHEFALEAIVLKRNRPVINIVGDTFSQPPTPWAHLSNADNKANLTAAIPSIGRIELPNHPKIPFGGTGFIVGPNLIMTNRHVAEIFSTGSGIRQLAFRSNLTAAVDFRREVIPTTPDLISVKRVAMIHPFWDMALLEVAESLDREPLVLSTRHPDELKESDIAIIGYPAQDPRNEVELQNRIFGGVFNVKRLQPGKIKSRRELNSFGNQVNTITHDSSTLGGNSGSAVIEIATGQVVGLHFAGLYLDANFAVPTFELARDPRVVSAGVGFDGSVASTNEWDSHWRRADDGESTTVSTGTGQTTTGNALQLKATPPPAAAPPAASATTSHANANTMTWTIPLQVSVTIGDPAAASASPPSQSAPGAGEPSENEFLFGRRKKQQDDAAIQLSLRKFSKQSLLNTKFDWLTALSATVFSRMAYWDRSEIRARALRTYQFDHCEVFTPGSMQAIVAIDEDLVLVAFRGTANRRNWLINLNTFGTEAGGYGKVHGGFYHAFHAARPALEQYIAQNAPADRKLVLAGHSLGGALATVAAAEWFQLYDLLSVYTVGQPAAGKRDFRQFVSEQFGDRYFRMVNEDDLVPMVPPGYKHVGQLLHFESDGTVARSMTESIGGAEDTLTETEFEALQSQMRRELELEETNDDPGTESIGQEGLPNTTDHGTDKYLRKILMQL